MHLNFKNMLFPEKKKNFFKNRYIFHLHIEVKWSEGPGRSAGCHGNHNDANLSFAKTSPSLLTELEYQV